MTNTIEQEFTTDGPVALIVHCPSGSVSVEPGGDSATVRVDTRRPDDWTVRQSGRTIEIRYEGRAGRRGGDARIVAAIPEHSDVTAKCASADIDVTVATRRCEINSASGDVSVGPAERLAVKTASGDVRSDGVAGDGSFRTASGDVNAATVFGDIVATTASGDVRVGTVAGSAKFSTASGEIRVSRYEGSDLTANSASGDIAIGLPAGRTVDLDAKTLSGRVELPTKREGGASGGPRVSIRAKTVSGDVILTRA